MTLTYWIANILDDHPAYSIRALTRKACTEERVASGNPERFVKPRKVVVHYKNAFDLVCSALGEAGIEHNTGFEPIK